MAWINSDGLEVKFGTEKTEPTLLGEYRFDGPTRVMEIDFDFTDLPAVASNSVIIGDNLSLPNGAFIEKVEISVSTDVDSAGDALTLNVGTIDMDRTSNADVDGLVVAATQTELNTGGTNVAGWVGAQVDTALTSAKLLTWEVDAAAATAGVGRIRVYYSVR